MLGKTINKLENDKYKAHARFTISEMLSQKEIDEMGIKHRFSDVAIINIAAERFPDIGYSLSNDDGRNLLQEVTRLSDELV